MAYTGPVQSRSIGNTRAGRSAWAAVAKRVSNGSRGANWVPGQSTASDEATPTPA
jgi:hypothetical protein